MPDLDEGKFYTADDMRRARQEGRANAAREDILAPTDSARVWADPQFRRELLITAAKAAQVAVRGRDDFARSIGIEGEDEDESIRQLLIPEDRAKKIIEQAVAATVKAELKEIFEDLRLDITTKNSRLAIGDRFKRTFDLEENSTKLLKRIGWQVFVGFITVAAAAVAAWFGLKISK